MRWAWLSVVLVLMCARITLADSLENAIAAYDRGDYATALPIFRSYATDGDASAQFYLGRMYAAGFGVPQDDGEAVRRLRKAADQGLAEAQFWLARMYATGHLGVTQSYGEAVRWFRRAADQGFAEAQYHLGFLYTFGRGVTQSYAEAVRWFRKAADQGLAEAQYSLGVMFANGQGVPQDDGEAVRWFRRAADQGFAEAQYSLGVRYEIGKGVTQDDVAAYMWFDLAAAQGHEYARKNLGAVANWMTSPQIAKAQRLARSLRKALQTSKITSQSQPRAKRSQAHQIQELLTSIGYDPGAVNGIMGGKTRAAIQQFQQDKGLPAHGEPDDATLKAMNLK